tara:strand:+ start:416 stop:1081 length:666 start_codon:yes stop_codon:yes gene_type:complete
MSEIRGIRNNNPGNVERNSTPWQGMCEVQTADSRFCVFESPKFGIRAIARILITYFDKRRAANGTPIDTVGELVARWAPKTENPTESYADFIRDGLGVNVGQQINILDYKTMRVVVEAIIRFENGSQPYDKATIDAGLRLAGIDVPVKPLHKSRTIVASTAATAATVAPLVADKIDSVKAVLEPLAATNDYIKYGVAALTLLSIGIIIWARIDDGQKETRG